MIFKCMFKSNIDIQAKISSQNSSVIHDEAQISTGNVKCIFDNAFKKHF